MNVQSYNDHQVPAQLSIHQASFLRPFNWLYLAWQDISHHPKVSLAYGLIVTILMLVTLLITSVHVYVIAAAITGFMLVGPVFSAGLCELSRQSQQNDLASFDSSLVGLKNSQSALIQFSAILLGFSILWFVISGILWFVISGLLLFMTIGNDTPSLQQLLWGSFLESVPPMQLVVYTIIGGLLASMVFVVSVISVPTIIADSVSAVDAMALSLKVTLSNLPTMLVWAALIVILTGLGFATFLVGMVIIYPLLAHATWHAYQDLVGSKT